MNYFYFMLGKPDDNIIKKFAC